MKARLHALQTLCCATLAVAGLPAPAQISTLTPPSGRSLPAGEQVEQEMASARFRLGPIRLLPFFTLGNVGWTNNAYVTSEGKVDDYTASVSLGTDFILPFGRKLFLRGRIAPSYDWYYRAEDLRTFGGNYSGEALGLFNRVTLGAGGSYSERIEGTTSEVARDVLNTTTRGFAKAEVEILKRLSVFAGAELYSLEARDKAPPTPGLSPVTGLNRTDSALRAGLRYTFSSALSFGVMAEEGQGRFDEDAELRDYDTRAILFVARYNRERLYVEGTVGGRDVNPLKPSDTFQAFSVGTYGYFVSYYLTRTLELQVVGRRSPVVSLFLDNPYYLEVMNGVKARLAVGRRLAIHAEGEMGSNQYVNPVLVVSTGEIVVRRDDTVRYGGGIDVEVSRIIRLGLSATMDRWDSNIDYYDREALRIMAGLSISAIFTREERR